MADILLFILLGILGREFLITIPLIICFSIIYIVKNKFKKYKALILVLFFTISFFQSYVRFNNLKDGNTISNTGIVTEVRTYDDYNRITILSGMNKFYTYDASKNFERGDKIEFNGILRKHNRRTMPLIFDARNYYYSNGINYKIENADIKFVSKTFLSKLERIREEAANIFDKNLSESAATISKGITLRYREDAAIIENIVDVGLSHILSVSGLHLGIIFSTIFLIVSITGIGIKLRYFIACIFMLIYSLIIGFTPSLLRALIMIFVLMYKRIYSPNISNEDSLLFAAIISLIINPYYIYSAGFILSYLCMYGIIVIYNKMKNIRKSSRNINNKILSAFFLNISIQIATLPVVLYYFNKFNVFSILINILLVPIFTLYLILSILFLGIFKIKILSLTIAFLLNYISKLFDTIASVFNNSFFNLIVESPPLIIILLYFIFLFYLINYSRIKYLKINYKRLLILLIILSIPNPINFKNNDRVEFLDVGQGDAALISIGKKNILIDSGGNPFNPGTVGKNIIEPYLIKTGRRKIDFAIVTHFDYDHVGGFTEVSDDIKIKNIFSGHEFNDEKKNEFAEKIKNLNFRILKDDAVLNINKNYKLSLIPGNDKLLNENNRSLVSVLRKKDFNIIYFSGDIEVDGENALINNSPKTFVLKVPHHGSKTSSQETFIDKVKPKNAVISVGRNNKYGHPDKNVLKRYTDKNINIYRTDRDGLITMDLNTLEFYKYNENNWGEWIIIYIMFIFSLFVILYKEDKWIIQYF